jgi:plasmid stability protein
MKDQTFTDATATLTIRGLSASVRTTLAARAKDRGMSLNAYVVERLTQSAEPEPPTMEEWLAELDSVRQLTGLLMDNIVAAMRAAHEERATGQS